MFHKKYLDENEYISLTQAAQRSRYTYNYLSKLVARGVIEKAPVEGVILVSVKSLEAWHRKC